jgi:ribonuclease J
VAQLEATLGGAGGMVATFDGELSRMRESLSVTGRGNRALSETLEADLTEFLNSAPKKLLGDDDKLDEALRRIVRQVTVEEIGKKPEVTVVVSRLMAE